MSLQRCYHSILRRLFQALLGKPPWQRFYLTWSRGFTWRDQVSGQQTAACRPSARHPSREWILPVIHPWDNPRLRPLDYSLWEINCDDSVAPVEMSQNPFSSSQMFHDSRFWFFILGEGTTFYWQYNTSPHCRQKGCSGSGKRTVLAPGLKLQGNTSLVTTADTRHLCSFSCSPTISFPLSCYVLCAFLFF